MKNNATATAVCVAITLLIGSLGAAGCVFVPADPAPQATERSQSTTTTQSSVRAPDVSTTTEKTATTKSSTY